MPVGGKPSVSHPDQFFETRKAKQNSEGPRPPDLPRHIQVDIRARISSAAGRQQSHVAQNFLTRHAQCFRGPIGLQRIHRKTTAAQNRQPEMHPSDAESALAVVEHPPRRRLSAHLAYSASRVNTPSTSRRISSGFSFFNSAGRAACGKS